MSSARSAASPPFGTRDLPDAQAVLDVLQHRHVREQRVILEDGVDVAEIRRLPRDVDPRELHGPFVGPLEAGDHAQQGRLARAGRAEHREELAVGDLEIDAVGGHDRAEAFADAGEAHRGCAGTRAGTRGDVARGAGHTFVPIATRYDAVARRARGGAGTIRIRRSGVARGVRTWQTIVPRAASAFDELLALLQEAADRFAGAEWGLVSPDDVAGGLRALANLLEGGLVGHFEDDPAQPVFRQIVTSTRKSLGDNADAIYYDASVSPEYAYRVRGRTAGAVYVSFTVEAGKRDGGFPERTAGVLNDTQFDVDADGRFEIYFGGPARARAIGSRSPTMRRAITTRHYWEEERSPGIPPTPDLALDIEVLDGPGPLPPPNDASVAAGLRRVANYVRSRSLEQTRPGEGDQPAFVSREPNAFPPPIPPGDHALAAFDAAYSMAPYVLGPDEALVITGRWPACRCANVSLWNRHLQTYDYADRRVSLNRAQTRLEPDGTFRIVIAHRDPGVPNWLDTEGRPFGLVFWRYFLAEGDIATPQAEVVTLP